MLATIVGFENLNRDQYDYKQARDRLDANAFWNFLSGLPPTSRNRLLNTGVKRADPASLPVSHVAPSREAWIPALTPLLSSICCVQYVDAHRPATAFPEELSGWHLLF